MQYPLVFKPRPAAARSPKAMCARSLASVASLAATPPSLNAFAQLNQCLIAGKVASQELVHICTQNCNHHESKMAVIGSNLSDRKIRLNLL